MKNLLQLFITCWEKLLFCVSLALLCVFIAVLLHNISERPESNVVRSSLPVVPRLFDREMPQARYFGPPGLKALSPNPFRAVFHFRKQSPEARARVKSAASQPAEQSSQPQEEQPPAPTRKVTILYRGLYTTLRGEHYLMLQLSQQPDGKPESFVVRPNESFAEGFKVVTHSIESITVQGPDNNSTVIPWNTSATIAF